MILKSLREQTIFSVNYTVLVICSRKVARRQKKSTFVLCKNFWSKLWFNLLLLYLVLFRVFLTFHIIIKISKHSFCTFLPSNEQITLLILYLCIHYVYSVKKVAVNLAWFTYDAGIPTIICRLSSQTVRREWRRLIGEVESNSPFPICGLRCLRSVFACLRQTFTYDGRFWRPHGDHLVDILQAWLRH